MTWWMDRSCLLSSYGCDPCDPTPCGPWVWSCEPPVRPRPVIHFDLPHAQIPMPTYPAVGVAPGEWDWQKKGNAEPCCGSCAKGGGCESECEGNKSKAGGHVGALYVSDAELDALGSQVALMGADVTEAAHKERSDLASKVSLGTAMKACFAAGLKWDDAGQKCLQEEDPTGASYVEALKKQGVSVGLTVYQNQRWLPYQLKWNSYRDQTFHEPSVYDSLRTELQTMVDEWKALGQSTRAVVPAPLADSSGSNAIPWGWIILGGVIIAIPFMLPAVAGTYLAVTRGRSMGF